MKIEAGKYYRTRDGQKVGPMKRNPGGGFAHSHPWTDASERTWTADGVWSPVKGYEDPDDIVAEWVDTPDLTAITTPFGLLDDATREALKAHGGPWEYFGARGDWIDWTNSQTWFPGLAYRVKPQPPKPREWWVVGRQAWETYAQAMNDCEHGETPIHVIEKLP